MQVLSGKKQMMIGLRFRMKMPSCSISRKIWLFEQLGSFCCCICCWEIYLWQKAEQLSLCISLLFSPPLPLPHLPSFLSPPSFFPPFSPDVILLMHLSTGMHHIHCQICNSQGSKRPQCQNSPLLQRQKVFGNPTLRNVYSNCQTWLKFSNTYKCNFPILFLCVIISNSLQIYGKNLTSFGLENLNPVVC